MESGILGTILGFGLGLVIIIGCLSLGALKILTGRSKQHHQQPDVEETKLIQELYQGLSRIEERVEALETLILDQDRHEQDEHDRKGERL